MLKDGSVTIKEAAKKLNLKYSAAKSIIKTFKKCGRVEKLCRKKQVVNIITIGFPQKETIVQLQ